MAICITRDRPHLVLALAVSILAAHPLGDTEPPFLLSCSPNSDTSEQQLWALGTSVFPPLHETVL